MLFTEKGVWAWEKPPQIVELAKSQGAVIALKDLTGIRDRTNTRPRSQTERRRSNSWALYQLREFIEYKALGAGVEVIFVNPCYIAVRINVRTFINPENFLQSTVPRSQIRRSLARSAILPKSVINVYIFIPLDLDLAPSLKLTG